MGRAEGGGDVGGTLAVSILTTDGVAKAEKVSDPSPPVTETSKRLKTWAVDVLNKLGPVPFPKDLGSGLGDGSVYFPPTQIGRDPVARGARHGAAAGRLGREGRARSELGRPGEVGGAPRPSPPRPRLTLYLARLGMSDPCVAGHIESWRSSAVSHLWSPSTRAPSRSTGSGAGASARRAPVAADVVAGRLPALRDVLNDDDAA